MLKLAAIAAAIFTFAATAAWAQKSGGVLRITHRDSPASMSIHEEGTISVVLPMMGVFNNLVVFDPHAPQNALEAVVPDLAKSWTWSEDGKRLTFALREGVTWHDGKPFTAADVKCTWDQLADKGEETFKVNLRKGWYSNVEAVTTNGAYEVVFNLKMPQPAILALLASGLTPVYPCHVSPRDMRRAQSARDRSSSSNIKATRVSRLVATRTTGSQVGPIWMGSNTPSSPTDRPLSSHSSPATSI
jgi:ABC-type transport system substrate-binding protein